MWNSSITIFAALYIFMGFDELVLIIKHFFSIMQDEGGFSFK